MGLDRRERSMVEARTAVRGTAWVFYAVLVLEILFLISPAAPIFYSFYGPALRFLDRFPETAWLTQFFLRISRRRRIRCSTCSDPRAGCSSFWGQSSS